MAFSTRSGTHGKGLSFTLPMARNSVGAPIRDADDLTGPAPFDLVLQSLAGHGPDVGVVFTSGPRRTHGQNHGDTEAVQS